MEPGTMLSETGITVITGHLFIWSKLAAHDTTFIKVFWFFFLYIVTMLPQKHVCPSCCKVAVRGEL